MKRGGSLRVRMMLLFCATVGVLLAASYFGLYLLLARTVRTQFDRRLMGAAAPVAADLRADADAQDVAELDLPGEYFELLDDSGQVIAISKSLQGRPLALGAPLGKIAAPVLRNLDDPARGRLRAAAMPVEQPTGERVLLLAMPTVERDRVLASFRQVLLLLFPCSLLVMAAVSAWYVGRSLRPIAELTRQTAAMTERLQGPPGASAAAPDSSRAASLAIANPSDDLGRLAIAFNQLSACVEAALGQLRQFVSDASHELRTPLSVLQGETELLLSEPRSPEEYRRTLHVIDGELKKLSRIVEGLFTLAMADAGQLRLAREPLYLDEVLEEACALAAPRAQAKGITIERVLGQGVAYTGDETFLRQLFLIFLENAIKYSPPATRVRVRLERSDGSVQVRFEDQGFGITHEHLSHIFERFYRVPQPGNGEAQSGGLGLAIAQAIVREQGGTIECVSTPGTGSSFTVHLPIPAAPRSAMVTG
jgi:two-component system OmpR family sensor kinase